MKTQHTEESAWKFVQEIAADLQRLNRMIANYQTASQIRGWYEKLETIEIPQTTDDVTLDFILENEAITTAIVVGYGRLYNQTTGTTRLKAKRVPKEHRSTHDELIDLRNNRYAHHGEHSSLDSSVEVVVFEDEVEVKLNASFGTYFGAAPHWKGLFDWLHSFLHEELESQFQYLTDKSGKRWRSFVPNMTPAGFSKPKFGR